MTTKKVKYLLPATQIDMGGFPVKQPLPTMKVDQVDPFLLLHHARNKVVKNRLAKHQGVGPHPHRGFSPVTFVIDGELHHRDSRGNNQVAKAGEVQWMNAGMGIVHSERPSQALVDRHGYQEIIQVWINSPADKKMMPPSYQYVREDAFPKIFSEDGKVTTKVVTGVYEQQSGPFESDSTLCMLWSESTAASRTMFDIPQDFNTMLYLIRGKIKLQGYGVIDAEHLVVFEIEGTTVEVEFVEASQFIIFSGLPIDEKIAQHGPFVMNTQTQILEAMRDYQMGKMGILIEDEMM